MTPNTVAFGLFIVGAGILIAYLLMDMWRWFICSWMPKRREVLRVRELAYKRKLNKLFGEWGKGGE